MKLSLPFSLHPIHLVLLTVTVFVGVFSNRVLGQQAPINPSGSELAINCIVDIPVKQPRDTTIAVGSMPGPTMEPVWLACFTAKEISGVRFRLERSRDGTPTIPLRPGVVYLDL